MASWHPDNTDEHECGQLRLAVVGEQVSLLPLPDETIPTSDEPQAVDEIATIHKMEIRRSFSGNHGHRYAVVLMFTDGTEKVLHDGPSYIDACMYRVSEADCAPPL